MSEHTLGLHKPNGGLGLAPSPDETAFLTRAKQAAGTPIPREIDVDEAAARIRTGLVTPATRRTRVPQFKTDPIGAIGFLLQQAGAGLQGKETPLERIKKEEAAQQVLELKRFRVGLNALGEFTKLPANQRAAAAEGFNSKFGEFLGLDFAELSAPTVDLDDVLALAKGIDPEILAPLSGDIESLQKTLLDQSKRGVLEEISDSRNLRPAMRKVMGAVDLLGKRLGPEDRAALAERRFTFADVADLAGPLGLTEPELAALERNQATAFPQLAEATGLQFTSEGVLQKAAEREPIEEAAKRAGAITKAQKQAELDVLGAKKASALLDETGAVKTAASSELRRQTVLMHGGFIDPRTGQVGGLTREAAQSAIAVAAEAERLIKTGKANSLAEATQKAADKIGIPIVEVPEIQIPEDTRKQLLAQNAEIASLLPFAHSLLGEVRIGTGALSNLAAIADATLGQVFDAFGAEDPIIAEDTQQARQNIRLFNQEVKRAIVNNPRFPKFEQEIVGDMLTDPDVWFTNPRSAVLRFRQLIEFMNRKLTTNGGLLQGRMPEGMKAGGGEASVTKRLRFDAQGNQIQ